MRNSDFANISDALKLQSSMVDGDNPNAEQEMAMRLDKLRVREALDARDVAVARLAEACVSVREKTEALNLQREETARLQKQLDGLQAHSSQKENIPGAGQTDNLNMNIYPRNVSLSDHFALLTLVDGNCEFKDDIGDPRQAVKLASEMDLSAGRVLKMMHEPNSNLAVLRDLSNVTSDLSVTSPSPLTSLASPLIDTPESPWSSLEGEHQVALPSVSTAEKIDARYAILASLPLPCDIPEDSLTPILIPPPYTLHDFIATTSGLLRTQLGNYRVFQQSTTTWCPEREEHGYCLTPVFKCSTNPRVTTAHRWFAVDISARLDTPTECFYNKDGKWYYAGVYKSFRLDDLCINEWECLSTETSQALIRETLSSRKNTSPQNIYETSQLYSAGALKVACVGLQCIGFNNTLYRSLLEHAALCTQTGKWRVSSGGFNVNVNTTGLGLGSAA
ncbi:hypothetical protein C8Q80DRAFT_1168343 [Daedaleopsis nitida]|nr:hypothetical protein C8Q80DRAFT_1168343 [Daedaleopsis nitida]